MSMWTRNGEPVDDTEVRPGDMPFRMFRAHGPVVRVDPYEPCPFGEGWRIAVLADGAGITLEPGSDPR